MNGLELARQAADLLAPLFLALVWITGCLLLATRPRHGALGAWLALPGLVGLWLVSTHPVARRLQAGLESRHPPRAAQELPRADAIVVLGGALEPAFGPRRSPDLNDAADRIVEAVRLWRAGVASHLVVSGGATVPGVAATEADAMREILVGLGVPAEAVSTETGSRNTRENCRRTAELLRAQRWTRVVLVTSALHMPRALAACRAAGIDAVPASADLRSVPLELPWWRRLAPDVDALEGSTRALREMLSFAAYRFLGWTDAPPAARPPD